MGSMTCRTVPAEVTTLAAITFGLAGDAVNTASLAAAHLKHRVRHSADIPRAMGQSGPVSLIPIGHNAGEAAMFISQVAPASTGCPAINKTTNAETIWNASFIYCFEGIRRMDAESVRWITGSRKRPGPRLRSGPSCFRYLLTGAASIRAQRALVAARAIGAFGRRCLLRQGRGAQNCYQRKQCQCTFHDPISFL